MSTCADVTFPRYICVWFFLLVIIIIFGIYDLRSADFGNFHRDALRTHLRKRYVDARRPMTLVTLATKLNIHIHRFELQNTQLSTAYFIRDFRTIRLDIRNRTQNHIYRSILLSSVYLIHLYLK